MNLKIKGFKKILFIILILIFGFSIFMLGYRFVDRYNSEKLNKKVREVYIESNIKEEDEKKQESTNMLPEVNKDILGWLNIKNTRINYPVVQSNDNDYYLQHNVEKKKSGRGSIFIDYRNKSLGEFIGKEKNIILYGHNMKDGSMFGDLEKYKDEAFFKENYVIIFDILSKSYKWKVFAAYVTDTDFNYINTDFQSDDEFNDFIKTIRKRSWYINDTTVNSKDIILTLSTCSYDFEDARFVVHFKLIKE